LDAAHLARGVVDRRFPGHFLPLVGDLLADHRPGDPIRVSGVPEGKATLHTRVAVIRVAVAIRGHADDLRLHALAFHFSLEAATHTAVGAGSGYRTIGLTQRDNRLFRQGGSGARLHASTAGNALGVEEGLVLTRGHLRLEAAALDRERKGTLHLVASAYTARA